MCSPTLYVGEHRHGLYALPSLVDSISATITAQAGHLLIEGPLMLPIDSDNESGSLSDRNIPIAHITDTDNDSQSIPHKRSVIVLGMKDISMKLKRTFHDLICSFISKVTTRFHLNIKSKINCCK